MHVHILGICGTFMAGIALLARSLGHRVTGADLNAWPPMSTQLESAGIVVRRDHDAEQLQPAPDIVVVGNVMTRGNACVEYLLEHELRYASGPAWLAEHVLRGRHVLAVAGTHGKTTTSSMLARVLEQAGLAPGFLIGGLPVDLGESARLGRGPFVIEADEYDTAFFDKRSKFVHYHPRTLVLNNLEFDHADIFPDLPAIQRQFHHLVRIVPAGGLIVCPSTDAALDEVLQMGCWTPLQRFGAGGEWQAKVSDAGGARFEVLHRDRCVGEVNWQQIGLHNVANALAAMAAAANVGVAPAAACATLSGFNGVRRRLEMRGCVRGVTVYDDFAHHPTAIQATIAALRTRPGGRVLTLLDPRSNTMRMGVHRDTLGPALNEADAVWLWLSPDVDLDVAPMHNILGHKLRVGADIDDIVQQVCAEATAGDRVLVMSNGAFGGVHQRLLSVLAHAG